MRPPIGGQAQAGVRLGALSTPTTVGPPTTPAMEEASITMAGVVTTTGTTMAEPMSHPFPAVAAMDTTRTSLASARTTMTEDTAVAGSDGAAMDR